MAASFFVFIGALAVIWAAFYPLESRCSCGNCALGRLMMMEIGVGGLLLLADELPGPRRLRRDEKVFAVTVLVAGVVTTPFVLGIPVFLCGLLYLVPHNPSRKLATMGELKKAPLGRA